MDLSRLWESTLGELEGLIGQTNVQVWLSKAVPVALDDNDLAVQVPNRYYADWIRDNYEGPITRALCEVLSRPTMSVRFIWVSDHAHHGVSTEIPVVDRAFGVNHNQSFDNFVVGECNKFAHAAASAVAQNPARQYNPLFIYGSTGLGKTHLMHAVANRVLRQRGDAHVVYVTAENFMNEMINCIRYKRMEDFRTKYRERSTLLLVDDIQTIAGRDRTQEEFFHTFNALSGTGSQVVITSDVTPSEIDKLEPRLRTRFDGGLLADMQAPDPETLMAILHQKADISRLTIPQDLAVMITERVAGSIRKLEGILNRILALHTFYEEPVTLEWARRRLPKIFEDPPAPTVTVTRIIEVVAGYHSIRPADILGKKRTRTLTRPRHIAMYLARKHTALSYPELGREFGDRDHSTIQHGHKKVDEALPDDPDLTTKVAMIEQTLGVSKRSR